MTNYSTTWKSMLMSIQYQTWVLNIRNTEASQLCETGFLMRLQSSCQMEELHSSQGSTEAKGLLLSFLMWLSEGLSSSLATGWKTQFLTKWGISMSWSMKWHLASHQNKWWERECYTRQSHILKNLISEATLSKLLPYTMGLESNPGALEAFIRV